jgi:tetratricopeptide (TPR) repeat protein
MITKRLSLVILGGMAIAMILSGGCIQIAQSPFDPQNPNYKEPEISNVSVELFLNEEGKAAEATITWTTDRETSSMVMYGTDGKLDSEAEDGRYVEDHSISLKSLEIDMAYKFKIESKDRSGREPGVYEDEFTTPGAKTLTDDGWKSYPADPDGAIKMFNQAILLNPNHAGAYNGLGWSYGRKGEVESAISHFLLAVGKDGTLAEAFIGLAGVYLTRGGGGADGKMDTPEDNEEALAIDAINSALGLIGTDDNSYVCPHNADVDIGSVYALRAKAYYVQGKLADAKKELESALLKKQGSPAATDLKSWLQEAGL